jgi:RNA-directed DNA polymerase
LTDEPRGAVKPAGVSRGHSTSLKYKGREGPNVKQEMEVTDSMDTQRQLKLTEMNPTREVVVKPRGPMGELSVSTVSGHQKSNGTKGMHLMEQVVSNENVVKALKHLEKKKGKAPGIDGMTISELRPYLRANWAELKASLLEGTYKPQPVRRTEIPKSGGGTGSRGS